MNVEDFGISEFLGSVFLIPIFLWYLYSMFSGFWGLFLLLSPNVKVGKTD